jgi:hypothetical protein
VTTRELDAMTKKQRDFCMQVAAMANALGWSNGLSTSEVRELMIKVAHNDPVWAAYTLMNPDLVSAVEEMVPAVAAIVVATPERSRD